MCAIGEGVGDRDFPGQYCLTLVRVVGKVTVCHPSILCAYYTHRQLSMVLILGIRYEYWD